MKIAAITPEIHIADCIYNTGLIIDHAKKAYEAGCDAAVFPAFALTGCSCGDLFTSMTLRKAVERALIRIKEESGHFRDMLIAVGFPGYNFYTGRGESCIAVIKNGVFEAFISGNKRSDITDDGFIIINGERYYFEYDDDMSPVMHKDKSLRFLTDHILFMPGQNIPDITVYMCSHELYAGSVSGKLKFMASGSGKTGADHICVSPGAGESVDECVYSGLKAYASGGKVIDLSLKTGMCVFDTDPGRKQETHFISHYGFDGKNLFIPDDQDASDMFCLDIMKVQATALGERLKYLHMSKCIIGLSGGLDSALALIAAVNAYDRCGMDRKDIICVTMPGFGTGSRTKDNAVRLAGFFGVTLMTIDIRDQTAVHLKSIGQPEEGGSFVSDVTFENAQARTRTMILMDLANKENAIVVGTGDMSELALGWCTYNGDHMSNFSVNAGIPKTVITPVLRTYISRVADRKNRDELSEILEDIIDTPVSPELLPAGEDGSIAQKTEDALGPYALHDFFLYHFLFNRNEDMRDIYEQAIEAFDGVYSKETVYETFRIFIKRFFIQQFKRSCMPVGPKVFECSLSPRSGFLMPSDACAGEWLREAEIKR